jgi:hypothetical protein
MKAGVHLLPRRWGCILLSHHVWVHGEVCYLADELRLCRCSEILWPMPSWLCPEARWLPEDRGSGARQGPHRNSEDRTSQLEILVIAAAAPRFSDQAGVNFEIGRCWAASTDGSKVRWAGLGRAILAAKHGRVLPLPRFDVASINQLTDIAAPTAAFVTPSSSPSSAPSSSTLSISHPVGHRSLAAVVADHRQHQPMAGAPPRPSSSSTAPAVAVPQGSRPAAPPVVRAQPLYAGPPGFQGGWQQGAPGAVGAPPAYRPPPVDGAGVDI